MSDVYLCVVGGGGIRATGESTGVCDGRPVSAVWDIVDRKEWGMLCRFLVGVGRGWGLCWSVGEGEAAVVEALGQEDNVGNGVVDG